MSEVNPDELHSLKFALNLGNLQREDLNAVCIQEGEFFYASAWFLGLNTVGISRVRTKAIAYALLAMGAKVLRHG